ncbi:MAG: HU family DNA-binding protein [Rhodoblastus sp.]|jgi:integration host factor subunit alpha
MSTNDAATLGRDQLAIAVYRAMPGLTRQRARELVDEVLAEIVDGLSEDRKVMLSGFGAFTIARKPDRPGRNPRTGEHHAISARSIVRFKASRMLKAQVAGKAEAHEAPAPKPRLRAGSRRHDHRSPEATAAG